VSSLIIKKNNDFENLYRVEGNIRIGRDLKNDIVLQSTAVSRVHATIERGDGDQYILFDKSQNGTWVNGKKIQREILAHNMSFVISDYQFYFKEDRPEDSDRLVINGTADSENDQIYLEETQWLSPELTPFSKIIQGISEAEIAFLDRMHELVDIIDSQELIAKILDLSLEMFPVDVAYLALRQSIRDDLITIDRKSRLGKTSLPFKVSQSIIQKVIKSGRPILIRDTQQQDNPSTSIMSIGAKTVACIPLKRRKETIGCLYIDSRRQSGILSEKDLNLLQFLSFLIAVAVENSRLIRIASPGADGCRENLMNEKPVYESEIMRDLFSKAFHCAPSPYSVLIRGEPGTGKDLLARAIHAYSGRNHKYVALNCAMIPSDLLESELFGVKKGAFSGATADHQGKIEAAAGGTLFLDEIGDLRFDLQPKLLRFLENKTFYRLGESHERRSDARIIAATNRDLKAMIQDNQFRQDLYDRLNTIPLHVPPLRERKEDITPLINLFSRKCAAENEREPFYFPEDTLEIMKKYHWPGNVRELLNLIRRVAVWIPEQQIRKDRLLAEWNISEAIPEMKGSRILKLEDVEKQHILFAISHNNWNVAKTARSLDIARDTLNRKMKKFKLKKPKNRR
jgi:transcriptional regulator with GAF, ATPase, and Fis domain